MPSIIELIAQELNISTASVSRALNDRPGVSQELRGRILEKARELNYSPNHTARGLATSQTFAAGFFIREKPGLPSESDPFYTQILHGAEQVFSQTSYHLAYASLNDEALANPASFRFTRERRVDGMILAGPDIPSDFILAMLQTGVPLVLVDNRLEFSGANSVSSDDEGGAYLAACHLIEIGHRNIGILSGPSEWSSSRRRVEGYYRALRDAGLPMAIVRSDRTTIESGNQSYLQLVSKTPQMTALCAVNDSMALGAIRAARSQGRRIPDDLSVVGFDDILWAQLNDPPLTTVHIPTRQMGVEAANRLISSMADQELAPTNVTVAVKLVKRGSTRPL
jgi:LacI family transcriptional regulator, galactose operon repressor